MEIKHGTSLYDTFTLMQREIERSHNVLTLVNYYINSAYSEIDVTKKQEFIQNAKMIIEDELKQIK